MNARPLTLQDMFSALNDDASGAHSPDISIDEAFSQLAVTSEVGHIRDGSVGGSITVTVAASSGWGTGQWGLLQWTN